MKRILLFVFVLISFSLSAQYVSSGNGEKISLKDIASADSLTVASQQPGEFDIYKDVTVSKGDILWLDTAVKKIIFHNGVTLQVNGSLQCASRVDMLEVDGSYPSANVEAYVIRFDSATPSMLSNISFKKGKSIILSHSNIQFDSCAFTGFVSPVIRMMYSNPVIRSCHFSNNAEAAINSAANTPSSPQILSCTFYHNVTGNANQPQINLGAGAEDSILIVGNRIEGAYSMSGGISVSNILAMQSTKVVLRGNTVINNRYGYNQQGYNIQSVIEHNEFKDNNLETNPMNGGSGVSIYGYDSISRTRLRYNVISGNLWGLTAINRHRIDMGTEADPGNNLFYDNLNNQTQYALYNNSYYNDIDAIGNYWGSNDTLWADSVVVDKCDNPQLGKVHYKPILTLNPIILSCWAVTDLELYMGELSLDPSDTNTFVITFPLSSLERLQQGLFDFELELPWGVTATCQNKPSVVSADTVLVYHVTTPHHESAIWKIRIEVSEPVNPVSLDKVVLVYPNPCRDGFNLQVPEGDYRMQLYNAMGQNIMQKEFHGSECHVTINRTGNYFLLLRDAQGNSVRKLVSVVK